MDILRRLCEASHEARRQIGVLLNRQGGVEYVITGTAEEIVIPALSRFKLAPGRLRGLRLIHTASADKGLDEDDMTDLALLRLDSVTVVTVGEEGRPETMETAYILPPEGEEMFGILEDTDPYNQKVDYLAFIEALDREIAAKTEALHMVKRGNYAVLTGVFKSKEEAKAALDELEELSRSADVGVASRLPQIRKDVHPKYIVGPGRLKDIVIKALNSGAEYLIFDNSLSPSQARDISEFTELKVIDRTQLILDIFAKRAKSNEGRLRVELAQLKYILPRLSSRDDALSRLTGGIGGRGPGETRLEVDKRRVGERIAFLSDKLKKTEKAREIQRVKRKRKELPVVSIVGYTNAGKSTLLNSLTKSEVYADDLLFATLDASSKRIRFPRERDVIITDTVGFIRDLPENLAGAFKSTLEELGEADLFLHVADVSDPHFKNHIKAVVKVLEDMGFADKERILVFNKTDKISEEDLRKYENRYPKAVFISAYDRKTFHTLLEKIEYFFFKEGLESAIKGGNPLNPLSGEEAP